MPSKSQVMVITLQEDSQTIDAEQMPGYEVIEHLTENNLFFEEDNDLQVAIWLESDEDTLTYTTEYEVIQLKEIK